MSYQFDTKIHALGVYWHAEVTYDFHLGDPDTNVADDIEITELWLIGAYPEGCESAAVDRDDYELVRQKADLDYLEPAEILELTRRCQQHYDKWVEGWLETDKEVAG